MEDKVPLHADHSMIVKFDNKNAPGYRSVVDKLRQLSKMRQGLLGLALYLAFARFFLVL